MITISISHIIYLDKNERYDLYHGKKIKKIGFFVPVCFCNGETSEPAHEIFCKYFLTNENEFTLISLDNYTSYKSTIKLVPRYLLLTLKYRF